MSVMLAYLLRRSMEPCPHPNPECWYYQHDPDHCTLTRHHLYWPRTDYADKIPNRFRDLPQNIVLLPRCEHEEIHCSEEPPDIPDMQVMRWAVQDEIERRKRIAKGGE